MFSVQALRRGVRLLSQQQKRKNATTPAADAAATNNNPYWVAPPVNAQERALERNYHLSKYFSRYEPIYVEGTGEPAWVTRLHREKTATAMIIGTIGYVIYANSREHKDTRLFDEVGDLNVPIFSPIFNWLGDRFGQMTKIYPDQDPFEHFTEDEKEQRMRALDSTGFFNRYWQDQGDDWDKYRLLNAATQEALLRRAVRSEFHPETDNTTISELRQHQANILTFKQPKLEVQMGEHIIAHDTRHDRYCHNTIEAYDAMFKSEKQQQFEKAAYKFNTQPLPSDVAAVDKLFGV